MNLSIVIGWTYFFCWAVCFYPQAILNWKKKSVAGLSIDFSLINFSGFLLYSIYNVTGYIYPGLGTGIVRPNDVMFAVHAFIFCSVWLAQVFIYERGAQKRFKSWAVYTTILCWASVCVTFAIEGIFEVVGVPKTISMLRFTGYGKVVITFQKYIPQIVLNYRRKSTEGYSILGVIFDFSGGVLSIVQLVIDMILNGLSTGEWSLFGGKTDAFNIVKFGLGVVSVILNTILIFQHFVLYSDPLHSKYPIPMNNVNKTEVEQLAYAECSKQSPDKLMSMRSPK
ncbi:unnamed protein product [Moneuplotes crassus]|uniref:Cystinosin n=1 Tax=Euplotes crassus TaxID=5936 RepID=A0AAD1XPJ9_EUPCR|nr:unnamed protein product [Moneuplotes crassus]